MSVSLSPYALFGSGHSLAWSWISRCEYPWDILHEISKLILEIGPTLDAAAYDHPADDVWIAKSATIAPTAFVGGPCIIGEETEVRHGAFIRGSALVGDKCVVGNSVELKNCILFDGVQVPHYNYVGDSVLGFRAHMGAGAVTSNVKSDKTMVAVHNDGEVIETYLKKMGAILGDFVEVGCNSVLNPGTIVCPRSNIYPLSSVRGVVPPDSILKSGKGVEIVPKE
ncbi:MAG: UDP-N-acetylglucosamine pyrophosphorylase [Clostridia bacterium]|nr:UDP-N-acetylglucosamine pyrophosphorylase [Clostridia bacterium]